VQLAGRLAKSIAASQVGKKILGGEGKDLLVQNIPGAITSGLFTLAGTGSVPAALTTAALDMGLSYGGARIAGKYSPGAEQTILRKNKAGDIETIKNYEMSMPQKIVSGVGNVASVMIAPSFFPATQVATEDPALLQQLTAEPMVMDQTASVQQQLMQRQMVNDLQAQSLSPGTMFQLQGIESSLGRNMPVDPRLDPYGIARGMQG
tara:strand:+ start:214 stop:831 length:618 start_codon:yes stop_codon:yes gene_type:complete